MVKMSAFRWWLWAHGLRPVKIFSHEKLMDRASWRYKLVVKWRRGLIWC